ncbi:TetR/AcrR family transcriptional regulator [Ornithinibacter aureus]|uniref:TetR/AcrR family transcriptional regulator n=1 Tax=Ornithinibacter aureus TaxID=622664 RepID=UPI001FECF0B7|nr:TetR/AcrR family transcriptional regulator [Ornithinibacter aureus]
MPSTTPLSESTLLAALAPAGGRQSAVGDVSDTAVRIMLAAADAFAQRGFHATTTRDIASRAGLSPAGVYVHFTSKEVLLFELSRRGHERARDLLVEAAAAADSPTEALRAIIGGFSRWHAEHYELGRIVQFEFRHLRPEHRDAVLGLRKEIDQVVAGVLRDGVDTGEFAVTDVPATALALLSMAIDVARWYTPDVRRTPAAIEATYGELAFRLVRPGEALAASVLS